MRTKSIKVTEPLHKELKIFAAKNSESILLFAEEALIEGLKKRKHSFQTPEKQLRIEYLLKNKEK